MEVEKKGKERLIILFLFVFSLSFYFLTICPSVYIHDSGELIAASWCLGIAHPAGSPLYCMAGKIFAMLLPFGSVALRYNLFSAIFASLSLVFLFNFLRYLKVSIQGSFAAVMAFGFSLVFWSEAVVAEVYTLNTFLLIAPLYAVALFFRTEKVKYLYMTGFLWGLLLANHMGLSPVSPLIWLIATVYLFFKLKMSPKKTVLTVFLMSLFFLLSFSLYIYLPVRSATNPPIDWGNTETFTNWFDHVTAKRIQGRMLTLSVSEYLERIVQYSKILWHQYFLLLFLSVTGIFLIVKKKRFFMNTVLLVILLADFLFVVFMDSAPLESEAYTIPSILILAVYIGMGFDFLIQKVDKRVSIVVALLISLFFCSWNFRKVDRSDNFIVYDSALNILKNCDENSILFNREDNKTFPLAYMRVVENRRPDLELIDRYGNIFENPYGELLFRLNEAERLERQRFVEEDITVRAFRAGRRVFFTDSYLGYSPVNDFVLCPKGAVSEMISSDAECNLDMHWNEPRGIDSENVYLDWMTRGIIAMNNLNLGDYYWAVGDSEKAMDFYDSAGSDMDNYSELHFILGQSLAGKGYFDKAEEQFLAAVNLKKNMWQAAFKLAMIYAERKQYYKAIEYFSTAVREQEGFYFLYEGLANAQSAVGLYKEAIDNYLKAIELAPQQWTVRYNYATTMIRMDRRDEAVKELSRVYVESGKNGGVGKMLARTYLDIGKYWNSRAICRELLERSPDNYEIQLMLGDANVGMGIYRTALKCYSKASEIAPEKLEAKYKEADTLERLGRIDEAIVAWKAFIDKAKVLGDSENMKKAENRLARLSNGVNVNGS